MRGATRAGARHRPPRGATPEGGHEAAAGTPGHVDAWHISAISVTLCSFELYRAIAPRLFASPSRPLSSPPRTISGDDEGDGVEAHELDLTFTDCTGRFVGRLLLVK